MTMTTTVRRSALRRQQCWWLAAAAGIATLVLCSSATRAHAQAITPAGLMSFTQAAYTAHEAQGELWITIQRTGDLSGQEHVGYGVKRQDAQPGIDFTPIANTYVTFEPGQRSYSFSVHIIDQGMSATPVHALAYIYGAYPDALGADNNAPITILHDDPLQPRDNTDPLGVPDPASGNLLDGATLYVDPTSASAQAQKRYARSRPSWARALGTIASEPSAHRFYMWNMHSNITGQVAHFLEATQVQQPNSTVMLSTYSLVHGRCGSTATAAARARYRAFIDQLAAGIGNYHVVFFLELDSLITAPCLTHPQLAIRDAELKDAIAALEALPHTLVYLDGGAADAAPVHTQARYLRHAGVAGAQGFFLNATHFDWMTSEIHYGQQISRLLGGAHFIINSGENGRGPLRPHDRVKNGNEVLCNPPGRGLGPLTVNKQIAQPSRYADADGFLWLSNPGGSGGQCVRGAPPTGVYWPAYAVGLARRWVHQVTGPHQPLTQVRGYMAIAARPANLRQHTARPSARTCRGTAPPHGAAADIAHRTPTAGVSAAAGNTSTCGC